ncbi:FG-GAP repeat domain-containing protein [Maritalea sp.]|uniref:FG-GAP repeat domain-containing protein n=1 Tax=Maritalea sp. TaxID=2003361 RepID=UPI003EF4F04F
MFHLKLIAILFLAVFHVSASLAQSPAPLQNSFVAKGEKQIAKAWLANPTTRYQHFVLGNRFEASSIVVELKGGQKHQYDLPTDLVFEDRHLRLADLDQDGTDEIVVVMSSSRKGAALAVFSADANGVKLKAQTPHIGLAFRWLNPAGIADFDGDGQLEIALVQKPHLTKRLEFWRLTSNGLKQVAAMPGFSNHRNGSRNQLMSAIYDVNKDGVDDLIIPSGDRRSIVALTLSPKSTVLKSWEAGGPVDGDFDLRVSGPTPQLIVTLANGVKRTIELD